MLAFESLRMNGNVFMSRSYTSFASVKVDCWVNACVRGQQISNQSFGNAASHPNRCASWIAAVRLSMSLFGALLVGLELF